MLQMADNQDAAAALQNGGEAGDGQDEQAREEEGFLDDLDDEYDDQEDVDVQVWVIKCCSVTAVDCADLAGVCLQPMCSAYVLALKELSAG